MGIINQRKNPDSESKSSVIQREGNSGINTLPDYRIPTGVPPVPRNTQGESDLYLKPVNAVDHYSSKEESSRPVVPFTGGWMEKKLSADHMKFLWDMIGNKGESCGEMLAGHVMDSYYLEDKEDYFYVNVLDPLMQEYMHNFGNPGDKIAVNNLHPFCLHKWWVNYQQQGEYNPTHDHTGCFSFVIWMKIPYTNEEQNETGTNPEVAIAKRAGKMSGHASNGSFEFHYTDIFGASHSFWYDMGTPLEGTMLLFPSNLKHQVYPFFNNDEYRISISGNIVLNTNTKIPVEMNTDLPDFVEPGKLERNHHSTGTSIVSLPEHTGKKIGEYHYPPYNDINEKLFHIIQDLGSGKTGVNPEEAHCTMTDWDLYSSQEHVKTMVDWVQRIIDDQFDPPEHDFKTVETWAVTYKEGEDIEWHNHGISCYSFVYYVNVPEGSSPLLFQNPEGIIDPKPGKVVIFESRMKHKVPPNKCNGRCAVSGNIFLKKHREL